MGSAGAAVSHHSDALILRLLFGAPTPLTFHGVQSADLYLWVKPVTFCVYLCTCQQLHDTEGEPHGHAKHAC